MSKIICDICGTTYPDTAQCCPICGSTQDSVDELLNEDLLADGAGISGGNAAARKKEIFDFDEVNADEDEVYDEEDEDEEEAYDEEEEEEAPRHNTLIVVLLTILIAGLLIAAGFIFVRYFLPNMGAEDAVPAQTTAAASEVIPETTEATIPCETLIISSGNVAELNAEGQHFLLHIKALPENTTDKIIYTSADENIATVTEDGRITAVSEGETKIFISCGKSNIECPVIIKYVEETVPATTEAAVVAETAGTEETVASEATTATEESAAATVPAVEDVDPEPSAPVRTDVVLKLKKTDIGLGVYYYVTLELDCDLAQNEVKWSSEHPHIATVDENGVVTAVKSGTTAITATYGDQSVTCMVRCG